MTRRYYPSTRERLTRALNEGVKQGRYAPCPYSSRNSGWPLMRAYYRGKWLMHMGRDINPRALPVVDLSAEFRDVVREIEADPPAVLLRGAA